MEIKKILSDKKLKPKTKVEKLGQDILDRKITINDLMVFAEIAKDAEKGTCVEALEFASGKNPKIITQKGFEFIAKHLADKAPRVKWECARVIGNTAHIFKNDLDIAIKNLLENAIYDGTVVRWSAAYALVEIIKLETEHNKKILPKIREICSKEEKPNIKKMYMDAMGQSNKE